MSVSFCTQFFLFFPPAVDTPTAKPSGATTTKPGSVSYNAFFKADTLLVEDNTGKPRKLYFDSFALIFQHWSTDFGPTLQVALEHYLKDYSDSVTVHYEASSLINTHDKETSLEATKKVMRFYQASTGIFMRFHHGRIQDAGSRNYTLKITATTAADGQKVLVGQKHGDL